MQSTVLPSAPPAVHHGILCAVQEKKSKHKSSRRHGSDSDGAGGSSSDGGGGMPRRRRRREQWDDPDDSGSDSGSEGEQGLAGQRGGSGGAGDDAGGGPQREDWMTKPMARQKTDAQLAAEEEERERAAEEERKRDPDRPFVSVRARPSFDGCGRCSGIVKVHGALLFSVKASLWTSQASPHTMVGSSSSGSLQIDASCCTHLPFQERELNPYLRNGGTGQPPEGEQAAAAGAVRAAGVGDGGASWRLKALKRAQQQAKEEVRQGSWLGTKPCQVPARLGKVALCPFV